MYLFRIFFIEVTYYHFPSFGDEMRGLYVEIIENKCEGMISVKNMTGDYYVYKERTHSLIGENLKRKYQLGDVVYIMVKKANVSKRHLDFELLK